MFKHLKYIDGTSDKFWEIQTNGISHTVTYGRNGTSGQSKTKSFASEETCLVDANKLIAEKTKKGYSEDGSVEILPRLDNNGQILSPSPTKIRKDEIVLAFKEIVREARINEIIPFLEKNASGNLELIKKEIKSAKRYWMDYVDLSKDPDFRKRATYGWGTRGNENQIRTVQLFALSVFSASDVGSWDFFVELFRQAKAPDVAEILAYSKPNWITEYLLRQIKTNDWNGISYIDLKYLEDKGYLSFEPELFGRTIGRFQYGDEKKVFAFILQNEDAIKRDVPLVFEYECNIHGLHYDYDYRKSDNELLWDKIFDQLITSKNITKEVILKGALEAQTKNWNTNLKGYFRKLIGRLDIDETLLMEEQQRFFSLLQSENNSVVNFVVDYLKQYFQHPEFQIEEFISWSEGVFMRNDLKTTIKTLLIQYDKLLKVKPNLKDLILNQVADIFIIPDLQLQERAAKFILKYQYNQSTELADKLTIYSEQMLGTVRNDLKDLMADLFYSEDEILAELNISTHEEYHYLPCQVNKLHSLIEYPENWNDILFKVGEVISSDDVIQMEILTNAWMMHCANFPIDYKKQLEPYIHQLTKVYRESVWFQKFSGFFINLYHNPNKLYSEKSHYYNYSKWMNMINSQLNLIQQRMIEGITLPLLSLPSHQPFWVSPEVLVRRLLDYQKRNVEIDLLDFSLALSRMPRENLDEAVVLLNQIENLRIKEILAYAFGIGEKIPFQKKSWLQSIVSSVTKNDWNWIGLWATVARTFNPEGVFNEFEDGILKDMPFAVQPYRPELKIEPVYYSRYDYTSKSSTQVLDGYQVFYDLPKHKESAETFIYHKDLFSRGNKYLYISSENVGYMHSVMPQNTESMSLYLFLSFNSRASYTDKRAGSFLREMLYDFFHFDDKSSLYFASSMFNKEKEVRAIATEVLISTLDQSKLPLNLVGNYLGFLITNNYGPIARLVEILENSRDVSSMHNHAVLQLLDHTFLNYQFTDKVPTNFKKLLELYFDLMHKEKYNFTESIRQVMLVFNSSKGLQPIIKKLLN